MELIFKTEKISPRVTRIFAFNTELMYLVEGEKKAALLDSGSGFGSLKACVDRLTEKPVTVLLTHGHTDHALGAAEFDDVWMSPLDKEAYAQHSAMAFRENSGTMWPEFVRLTQDQIIPAMPFEQMKELHSGDVFDLGDVEIEALACPGHTPGSLAFLIRQERMLLLGDACNYMTFLFDEFASPVPAYYRTLMALRDKTQGRYDRVLLSHGDGEGVADMIQCVAKVCEDIMEGRSDKAPFDFLGAKAYIAKAVGPDRQRLDGGFGNIIYSE